MDTEPPSVSSEERSMAVLSHVLAFLGYAIPFGQLIAPYAILLIRRDESDFIAHHARESLNFQITITISLLAALALTSIWIGYLLLPVVLVYSAIMVLIAASRASRREPYTYPFALRLVQ
jgi:uncharacterized Tic20 family protein